MKEIVKFLFPQTGKTLSLPDVSPHPEKPIRADYRLTGSSTKIRKNIKIADSDNAQPTHNSTTE